MGLPPPATGPASTATSSCLFCTYSPFPPLATPPLPSPAVLFFDRPRPWPSPATHSMSPPSPHHHLAFLSFSFPGLPQPVVSTWPQCPLLWPPLIVAIRSSRPPPLAEPLFSLSLLANPEIALVGAVLSHRRHRWEQCRLLGFLADLLLVAPPHQAILPAHLLAEIFSYTVAKFLGLFTGDLPLSLPTSRNLDGCHSGQISLGPSCIPQPWLSLPLAK